MPVKKKTQARKPAATKKSGVKPGTSKGSKDERKPLFVDAYIANGENGTRAYMEVYELDNQKSAAVLANRLLKDVKVQALLAERRGELREKFEFKSEDAIRSLSQAVKFDPRKLFNDDDTLKRIRDLDDDTAMALASIETVEMVGATGPAAALLRQLKDAGETGKDVELEPQPQGGALKREHSRLALYTHKVKWLDKNTARDQAMKHLGLYKLDNAQRGNDVIRALLETVAGSGADKLDVKT